MAVQEMYVDHGRVRCPRRFLKFHPDRPEIPLDVDLDVCLSCPFFVALSSTEPQKLTCTGELTMHDWFDLGKRWSEV